MPMELPVLTLLQSPHPMPYLHLDPMALALLRCLLTRNDTDHRVCTAAVETELIQSWPERGRCSRIWKAP